jgi:glycosyltransferase involved in cell wall biosynthesis
MVTEYALCFRGRLQDELGAAGATVFHLGNVRARQPRTVWRVRKALKDLLQRERFDVVVCHSAWSQAIFGKVVRQAGFPLVFWLHDVVSGRHWLERWASRTLPDLVICNSKFTANLVPKIFPNALCKVVYCPMPDVGMSSTQMNRDMTRRELGTAVDAVVIIQVGRMETLKGHALHLKALSRLRDVPHWVLWQVGGAQRPREISYLNELKHEAAALGIADRVRFLGERADVPGLLQAADIYCQPNIEPEAFGLTLVEGLAAGLPVVTTEIGGAREIVDSTCGLFIPANDGAALAATLKRLIADDDLRSRFGAAGPSRAKELCDPASQIIKLTEALREVAFTLQPEINSATVANFAG